MKIKFFISDNELAPTTISAKLIIACLLERGFDVEVINDTQKKLALLKNPDYDMIIFQKKIGRGHTYPDIKHLKGIVKLVFIDDDFLGMDSAHHVQTLNHADLILVGNKQHQGLMGDYVDVPVETFTSILDFHNYPYMGYASKHNNPLIISWQQSLADVYIEDLLSIKDVLIDLHNKHHIHLHLYGWHEGKHYHVPDKRPVIKKALPFATCVSFQPYEGYVKNIVPQIAASDIAIVPYVNRSDRYGKSGFALKRTMLLGVPLVVSNIGVHEELIQDGVNGFIAENKEEWYQKLEDLIIHGELRQQFSLQARHVMESKFSYEQCTDIFIQAIHKHIPTFKPS